MQLLKRHPDKFSSLLNEQGVQFTSNMLKELSPLIEFLSKQETLRTPQRIGVVERSDTSLKRILNSN